MPAITIYRADDGDCEPLECTCEKVGYPNDCTLPDGETERQYVNTHFVTKAEAWKRLLESSDAGVRLGGRRVAQCKLELLQAQIQAADDAERWAKVRDGYRNFQREGK
jgi:hypothetical protein